MAEMEIVTGPAGSGKTASLLDAYRAAAEAGQRAQRPGRTLWLAPTFLVGEQVRRQLRAPQTAVLLAPQVLTFDGFADRILQFSSEVMRSVPPVMQRVLMRQIIDDELAAGRIEYFAGIANTSGFLDVVLGLVAELKREEAWPDDFSQACRQRGARRSDTELAGIYKAYQEKLTEHHRYDGEGRFWSARDQLDQGLWGPFPEFDLVVVDGFSDFTHTQYEILGHLALRSRRMLLSLPLEDTDGRADLFAKPHLALQQLRRIVNCRVAPVVQEKSAKLLPSAIQYISTHLFANPRETQPAVHAEGVEVLAVAGMQGEVRAIAERVKGLLIQGIPARDIVVAFRPLADYAPLVREIFSAAGIPFQCTAPEPLNQQPVIKALISVLQLELEDWPFDRLYSLLNSGWFRPRWPEWSAEKTPRMTASALRRAKIPGQRSAILATFELFSQPDVSAGESEETEESTHVGNALAGRCLNRLSDALLPLRQKRDARSWADALLAAARDLGITPQSVEADGQDAVDAWKAFEELLFIAAGTEELLGLGRRRLELSELFSELFNLLQHQSMPCGGRQPGTVEILEAAQVRGLDVPYLFLGGLTESSFPQRGGETFLYTEADRKELNEQGLTLGHRTAQTQAEMLLFYSIVTRARKTLTLSYPAVNLNGQPLAASSYLTAVRELFAPAALKVTRIEHLDPVPEVGNMLSLADLRVVATSEALQRRPRWFQTLAAHSEGRKITPSIVAAIDMSIERFQTRGFSRYEGVLQQSANLAFLREKFAPSQEFSATQLEAYAQCPYRFWVGNVLKIGEIESPDQFTDYRLRGSMVHDILVELHSQLEPTPEAIPSEAAVALFRELLRKRLETELSETDLHAALLRIEQRLLEEWGDEYAQQWANYHEKLREQSGGFLKPALFEVSFGTPHAPAEDEVLRPSLTLGHGGNETRIRGRIDRIDVGNVGQQAVFNIIDYKTGRKPVTSASHIKSGRALQLVLYALAAQRLDLAGTNALPIQAGYWCLKESGWTPIGKPPKFGPDGLQQHEDWLALVDVLDELVPRLAAGIRAGQFPVYNTDTSCMSYCPYRTTCRVSQIRPLEESLDKHWEP